MNEAIVENDMQKSFTLVNNSVKPVVEKLLPGWHLTQVEGKNNEVCKMLDISCGVDYLLHSEKSALVLGIASRIQYDKNYRTFTVRKERESGALTEYEKRKQAISIGAIYPYYTMQAYMNDNKVSGLAITKTADLIDFIKNGYAEEKHTSFDKIGQANFYVCEWDFMKYCGYKVLEYKGE